MFLTRAALALSLALTPLPALAQSAADDLRATITGWEQRLDGRIGVAVHDSGTGWSWGYRQDERFLMNSTVKVPLCAAVLARVEGGDLALDEMLPVTQDDIVTHAPVTKRHVGSGMTIADLCLATIDQSDNTAANLLFERLGGPTELTKFLRGIGDEVSRSDRLEPALNVLAKGDDRDTTTPAAMANTLQALLTGDALPPAARAQLADWMRPGGVTGALLRPSVPAGWDVADKSGSGDNSRTLAAMVTPPGGAPVFISISVSDTSADMSARNAAVADIGGAVMKMVTVRP